MDPETRIVTLILTLKGTLIVALKGILVVALTGTLNPKRPST